MCYFQIMNIWMLKSISINTITDSKMEHFGTCRLRSNIFPVLFNHDTLLLYFQFAFI